MLVKFSFDQVIELGGCGNMIQEVHTKGFQYIDLNKYQIRRLQERECLVYKVGCNWEENIYAEVEMEILEDVKHKEIFILFSTHDIFSQQLTVQEKEVIESFRDGKKRKNWDLNRLADIEFGEDILQLILERREEKVLPKSMEKRLIKEYPSFINITTIDFLYYKYLPYLIKNGRSINDKNKNGEDVLYNLMNGGDHDSEHVKKWILFCIENGAEIRDDYDSHNLDVQEAIDKARLKK